MIDAQCIGEPISWPRLEAFARDHRDGAVQAHVAECAACRYCLDEIERDVVALPPLTVQAKRARRPWWHFAIPVGALALAAAFLVLILDPTQVLHRKPKTTIKGIGVVTLGVVRERDGSIRQDIVSFREGDRFKLVITCPPDATAHVEVRIHEEGAASYDEPLPPADLACGNRIVVPGAFSLTGTHAHKVCVEVTSRTGETGEACLTLVPE